MAKVDPRTVKFLIVAVLAAIVVTIANALIDFGAALHDLLHAH
jgi:hypothetical protein